MAQETFQLYKFAPWSDDELTVLRVAISSYEGPHMGPRSRFRKHIQERMPHRSFEGIRNGIRILNGHGQRGSKWRNRKVFVERPALADTEAAYLAALFEGEGYITCDRNSHWVLCLLTNTDESLLRFVEEKIKFVRRNQLRPKDNRKSKKVCFQIIVTGHWGMTECCNIILPYLRGYKKAKVEAFLNGARNLR